MGEQGEMMAEAGMTAEHALQVDPKRHTVDFENDKVRIVRIKYGPNEKVVTHSHPAGVVVFVTDQHVRFNLPDGTSQEIKAKAGDAVWMEATTHQPENLTDKPLEALYIEVK